MLSTKMKILVMGAAIAGAFLVSGCGGTASSVKPETRNGVFSTGDKINQTIYVKYDNTEIELQGKKYPSYTIYWTNDSQFHKKGDINIWGKERDFIIEDGKIWKPAPNGKVQVGTYKPEEVEIKPQSGLNEGLYKKQNVKEPTEEELQKRIY